MKYKSLEFLSINKYDISNLFVLDDYYYFESDMSIKNAEQISDEEFAEAVASIVIESIEQEITQLDRIESAVSNTLDEIRAEAVDEYTLSLMENNII